MDIKEQLCRDVDRFAAKAVEFCMQHPEQACPVLMEIIDDEVQHQQRHPSCKHGGHFGPIYAATLLGYHRHAPAHALLVKGCTDINDADDLWGDLLTEGFSSILWATSDGRTDLLLTLLNHRTANVWARGAAADALTLGVALGDYPRDAVVPALQQSIYRELDAQPTEDSSTFVGLVANSLYDVGPHESTELLEQTYEDWRDMFDKEELDERLTLPVEQCLARHKAGARHETYLDPMQLAKWATFTERSSRLALHQLAQEEAQQRKRQQDKRKAKRQQAKKARKKSRRK